MWRSESALRWFAHAAGNVTEQACAGAERARLLVDLAVA
jgi:hypothetical protein